MAETFADRQRFQIGEMDDAAECFVGVYFIILSDIIYFLSVLIETLLMIIS